jgi:uncharacterized membrane protein YsdA (DUF1294 family)
MAEFLNAVQIIAVVALLGWNVIVFCLYGHDKRLAKSPRKLHRISEKTLLLAAVFLGGAGAFAGMQVFRHKTHKRRFALLVPVLFALQAALILWLRIKI